MGFRVAQDCDLGLTLAHGGGYPGYGSYLLLLPEHGVGHLRLRQPHLCRPVAAGLAGGARAAPRGPADGRATCRSATRSPPITALPAASGSAAAWSRGRRRLAMNFLMDRSAENWAREFARLKAQTGDAETDAPIDADRRALRHLQPGPASAAGSQGQLLLAPTSPPTIQALRLQRRAEPQ